MLHQSDNEDGGNMFLQNGNHLQDHEVSQTRKSRSTRFYSADKKVNLRCKHRYNESINEKVYSEQRFIIIKIYVQHKLIHVICISGSADYNGNYHGNGKRRDKYKRRILHRLQADTSCLVHCTSIIT
jgi:hypothetical protein